MMVQEQELITIFEATQRFGVSDRTIRYWLSSGRISRYKAEMVRGTYVDAGEIAEKLRIVRVRPNKEQKHE